jgi:Cd2+/Zn2+-exporting ATPase
MNRDNSLAAGPISATGARADGDLDTEHDKTARGESSAPQGGNPPFGDDDEHEHAETPAASSHKASGDTHDHRGGLFGQHAELAFAVGSDAALLLGWLLDLRGATSIALLGYIAAYALGGFFTLREAIGNLLEKRFKIDTLMLVAAAGAAILGKWAEGALLLALFSLGHALEEFAMGRARRAIESLSKLAPDKATVRSGGAMKHVPVEALEIGDIVIVKPNERLPADGVVIAGESSVNQAPITGESAPVDKRPLSGLPSAGLDFGKLAAEHRVFAGTINGAGALDVWVARRADESTLARVARMVAEAETGRSPTQSFTDRFERLFVPCVLALVAILMFAFVVVDEPFSESLYRAMAVLVAASPCALAISVPSAVLSGIRRAARGGVLVKGGAALENLGTLNVVAFDKTGTLTEGKPRLTDIAPAAGVSETELLAVSVAIEEKSDHPLAAAVVRDGMKKLSNPARFKPTPSKASPARASGAASRPTSSISVSRRCLTGPMGLACRTAFARTRAGWRRRAAPSWSCGAAQIILAHSGFSTSSASRRAP